MEYSLGLDERAAKRAAYGPIREREQQARRKLSLSRSAARESPAAAAARCGGGGDGGAGGRVDAHGNGAARDDADAELTEANRGLPAGWSAKWSTKWGRIYWFHQGSYGSSQWSRPDAGATSGEGGARGP